jgi:ABC-2 type transport system permease protein
MIAKRIILQLIRDRRTFALIFVVPLVVLTIAGILIQVSSGDVVVGVYNQDEGATVMVANVNLGDAVAASLDAMDGVIVKTLDADETETAIEDGIVDVLVTFAPDFSAQTREAGRVTLDVVLEGSDPMIARRAEGYLTRASIEAMANLASLGMGVGLSMENGELPASINSTYVYGGAEFDTMDYIAPFFIGMFAFFFIYLLTSVAFLRERAAGTLERLQATSATRLEIVVGYMLGFSVFALAQSVVILLFTVYALGVHYNGQLWTVFVVELLLTLVSVNMGIFLSTFARNEFQVVQFIPLVVVTQILLSGAFWAVEDMPSWLQPAAWLMPLTYANRALRDVMIKGFALGDVLVYLAVLTVFGVLMIALGVSTISRQRA